MCGFVGFTNLEKSFDTKDNFIIKNMTRSLAHRGPDEEDFFTCCIISGCAPIYR